MNILEQKTVNEINKQIAQNLARLRKRKGITQMILSQRSGVSLGSIKRFERTGEISLHSFTQIAIALGIERELEKLFSDIPPLSIDEVIKENKHEKSK